MGTSTHGFIDIEEASLMRIPEIRPRRGSNSGR